MARYWQKLNYLFRFYFILALVVLISITSGGIFGYLSDGYQKTKGTYDVSEKEVVFLTSKIDMFTAQKKQVDDRINSISASRKGQEARLDSLYSRKQVSSAKGVESYIQKSSKDIEDLTNKSNVYGDSLSKYSMMKLEKENKNATGELGPLKYLAKIFNTDMDTIVKYFIMMLIFVFDPLAILLFVSLNIIIKNESEGIADVEEKEGVFSKAGKKLFEKIKKNEDPKQDVIEPIVESVALPEEKEVKPVEIILPKLEKSVDTIIDVEPEDDSFANSLLTHEVEDLPCDVDIVNESDDTHLTDQESNDINIDFNITPIEQETPKTEENAHAFYHGDNPASVDWHTANLNNQAIHKINEADKKKIKTPETNPDTKVY